MSQESLLKPALGLTALRCLGFEPAINSSLVPKMRCIKPYGVTAMRDSVIFGIQMMLQLYEILAKCEIAHVWNFVHVVLTDGEDTSSEASLSETCELMRKISQVIPVRALKTWFVGIDLDSQGAGVTEINSLVQSGGENAEFTNVSDANIEQIFNQLSVKIGLVRQIKAEGVQVGDDIAIHIQQQDYAIMSVEEQHYVVIFNLDVSSSMCERWGKVCDSVSRFINQMGPGDLVAGLAFDTKVTLITRPPELPKPVIILVEEQSEEQREEISRVMMYCILILCVICPIYYCFSVRKLKRYGMLEKALYAACLGLFAYYTLYEFTS